MAYRVGSMPTAPRRRSRDAGGNPPRSNPDVPPSPPRDGGRRLPSDGAKRGNPRGRRTTNPGPSPTPPYGGNPPGLNPPRVPRDGGLNPRPRRPRDPGLNPRPAAPRRPGARRGDVTFGPRNGRPSDEDILRKAINDNKRKAWRKRTQARVDKYGWQGYQRRFGDDARQQKPAWLKRSPVAARRTRSRNGTA